MFRRLAILLCLLTVLLQAAKPARPARKAAARQSNSLETQWARLEKELRGRESERVAANKILVRNGWVPIPRKADLAKMYSMGRLVDLPVNPYLKVDTDQIPAQRRVTTPGFAKYVLGFSRMLQIPLTYSSGARSAEDQKEIAHHNGNAAPTTGPKVSAHLYPPAIDFTYVNMALADRIRFANFLKAEKQAGNIQLAIEKSQHCFHVVYLREKAAGPPVFATKPSAPKKAAPKKRVKR